MFRLPYNERMHVPLKSAVQFINLDRKKLLFQKKRLIFKDSNFRHLIPEVLEFLAGGAEGWPNEIAREAVRQGLREACELAINRAGDTRLLEMSDLLVLHKKIAGSEKGFFRVAGASTLSPALEPIEPELVARALGRFFEWAGSPSFQEMHPVEQMTVSQVRLFELQPFQEHSEMTSFVFSSLFLLKKGYLLPLFRSREVSEFRQAMLSALEKFETAPLISLNLKACERAYDAVFVTG
jgi:hypothetical protein